MYMYVSIIIYIDVFMHACVNMYVRVCAYFGLLICVLVYVCVCAYLYVFTHVCVCVYVLVDVF